MVTNNELFNINTTMYDRTLKITFKSKNIEANIDFEGLYGAVCGFIESYHKNSYFVVKVRNEMCREDLCMIMQDLCNYINVQYDYRSKYYHNNEIISAVSNNLLSEITFYIRMTK